MFEAISACVLRDNRPILDDVTLRLEPGLFTVIIGPNGAGKSTLLRCLIGEITPERGELRLDRRPLSRWSESELAQRRAVLPQSSHLAFPFTVYEVVALGAEACGQGLSSQQRRDLPAQALAQVGLEGYEGRFYQTLSGGEQQRVHLARVLCQVPEAVVDDVPRWLFLDEPTSSLDIEHQFTILGLARDRVAAGAGVVAVLHDLNMAALYADRLIVMSKGRVVADGAPASVLDDTLIERVFNVSLKVNLAPQGLAPFVLPHSADGPALR